jgi:mannitol 2-dehydrogenase
MKLRILNGGHALIAYSSALLGHRLVHEAIRDPLISGFLRKIMLEEIVPPLVHSSGKKVPELMAYFEQVEKRLQNPQIEDAIQRLCADGSNRQPKFIIPSIEDAIR